MAAPAGTVNWADSCKEHFVARDMRIPVDAITFDLKCEAGQSRTLNMEEARARLKSILEVPSLQTDVHGLLVWQVDATGM